MKPQRPFVFISAAITAATGVAAVIAGRQAANDLVMTAVEPTMASTVIFLGLATICAGVVGLCGGCSESRCGVLFFPSCTLLIGVACIIGGGIVLSQANGDGGSIEEACWTRQKTGNLQFQKARALQDDFDSLQAALSNCRKSRPEVLSLRDCGQLAKDDVGIWYKDRPRRALVEWLEQKFSCGGFCAADVAVFGYPWQQPQNGSLAVTQSNKNTPRDPCFTFLAQELAKRGSKVLTRSPHAVDTGFATAGRTAHGVAGAGHRQCLWSVVAGLFATASCPSRFTEAGCLVLVALK
mmetsp:Transcript_35237/g.92319  ORF Transcript_35237/g.92319 Transcript_35237/m.92319 type:complete len:295 (-) Transcript_35237:108-992(-)